MFEKFEEVDLTKLLECDVVEYLECVDKSRQDHGMGPYFYGYKAGQEVYKARIGRMGPIEVIPKMDLGSLFRFYGMVNGTDAIYYQADGKNCIQDTIWKAILEKLALLLDKDFIWNEIDYVRMVDLTLPTDISAPIRLTFYFKNSTFVSINSFPTDLTVSLFGPYLDQSSIHKLLLQNDVTIKAVFLGDGIHGDTYNLWARRLYRASPNTVTNYYGFWQRESESIAALELSERKVLERDFLTQMPR